MEIYLANGTEVNLKTCYGHAIFEVLTVVKIKIMVYWDGHGVR
jgi:uncharacterized membrane protein